MVAKRPDHYIQTSMSHPKLGTLPEGKQRRDAIHIAVAPVLAGQVLKPGQPIRLQRDRNRTAIAKDDPIGIVDPFLKEDVQPGQQFWMVLFPDTVQGLRHDWQHPSMDLEGFDDSLGSAWDCQGCETDDPPLDEAGCAPGCG